MLQNWNACSMVQWGLCIALKGLKLVPYSENELEYCCTPEKERGSFALRGVESPIAAICLTHPTALSKIEELRLI